MACTTCKNKNMFQISKTWNWMAVLSMYGFGAVVYTTYQIITYVISLF